MSDQPPTTLVTCPTIKTPFQWKGAYLVDADGTTILRPDQKDSDTGWGTTWTIAGQREAVANALNSAASASAECERLRERVGELEKAIRGALNIKALWCAPVNSPIEHQDEAIALCRMERDFEAALSPSEVKHET